MRSAPLRAFIVLGVFLSASTPAHAGKVEEVRKAVRDVCKKEIPAKDLLVAIIAAFDCQPNERVNVTDCEIRCLKANSGKVVGDR